MKPDIVSHVAGQADLSIRLAVPPRLPPVRRGVTAHHWAASISKSILSPMRAADIVMVRHAECLSK